MKFILRIVFAINAPAVPGYFAIEIPEWGIFPKRPSFDELSESDKEQVKDWIDGGSDDLPDNLQWFEAAWKKYKREQRITSVRLIAFKECKWRWFYADMMLEARK